MLHTFNAIKIDKKKFRLNSEYLYIYISAILIFLDNEMFISHRYYDYNLSVCWCKIMCVNHLFSFSFLKIVHFSPPLNCLYIENVRVMLIVFCLQFGKEKWKKINKNSSAALPVAVRRCLVDCKKESR